MYIRNIAIGATILNGQIIIIIIILARTPEFGQGLGRILSCGARKPEPEEWADTLWECADIAPADFCAQN